MVEVSALFCICPQIKACCILCLCSDMIGFEKAYCEYRLNRVEHALKTLQGIPEQTDKLKELYGQVVRTVGLVSAFGVMSLLNAGNDASCVCSCTDWSGMTSVWPFIKT